MKPRSIVSSVVLLILAASVWELIATGADLTAKVAIEEAAAHAPVVSNATSDYKSKGQYGGYLHFVGYAAYYCGGTKDTQCIVAANRPKKIPSCGEGCIVIFFHIPKTGKPEGT
jgi:hypothetical protein